MADDEEMFEALDALVAASHDNIRRNEIVIARAERIRRERQAGLSWSKIVSAEHRPLIVEVLTQNMSALSQAGSRLRRLEAQALHDEGLSMDKIAQLFGVTRQRISELLRKAPAEKGPAQ